MRQLPLRPDADHLRRQARELHRAALSGDPKAIKRLGAIAAGITLSSAQLALAREYGFPSWTKLKAEVARRRAASSRPPGEHYLIRAVESLDELAQAFDITMAQMAQPVLHDDRRFRDLARHFAKDRELMLVVEDRDRIVGGAFMFNTTLRAIGLEPTVRGKGLGRRLLARLEETAARHGAVGINLGVGPGPSATRDFFAHMGYSGRSRMAKQLAFSPDIRYPDRGHWRQRLAELRERRAQRRSAG